jgi:hypothetical protein
MKKKLKILMIDLFLMVASGMFYDIATTKQPGNIPPGPASEDLTPVELGRKIFLEETFG